MIWAHSGIIDGKRYFWLFDDAMISMRYAHNMARGFGLVWNPGEAVEGYTNFLWTLYMAAIHLLPIPITHTSLAVHISNAFLAILTLVGLPRLVRSLGGGLMACAVASVALALNVDLLFWAVSGLETLALTCAVTWASVWIFEGAGTQQPDFRPFVLLGVMPLIRVDSIVISGCLYGLALATYRDKKRTLRLIGLSLLLPLAHEIFRIAFYHDFIPNTARLKTSGWPGRFSAGRAYVGMILFEYLPLFCIAILGAVMLRSRKIGAVVALLAISLFYSAYAGGDAFPYNRFLTPLLPSLFAAVAAVLFTAGKTRGEGSKPKVRLAVACGSVAIMAVWFAPNLMLRRPDPHPWNLKDEGNVRIALLVKQQLPASARVADFWAGNSFYFNDCYGIDLLGKMDSHIANRPVVSKGTKPGHNKWDFDFSLRTLKADYVAANFRGPITEAQATKLAEGDWGFAGAIYFNRTFAQDYYPNPMPWNTFRTVYARKRN
ncbi:hypothetical protein EON80_15120 [bacterium]|nr:MAG: hypothetical protein EON80_15120 [bacterium]